MAKVRAHRPASWDAGPPPERLATPGRAAGARSIPAGDGRRFCPAPEDEPRPRLRVWRRDRGAEGGGKRPPLLTCAASPAPRSLCAGAGEARETPAVPPACLGRRRGARCRGRMSTEPGLATLAPRRPGAKPRQDHLVMWPGLAQPGPGQSAGPWRLPRRAGK